MVVICTLTATLICTIQFLKVIILELQQQLRFHVRPKDGINAKIEKVITAYTAYRDGGGFGLMLNMAGFVSSGFPGMSDVIGLYSNIFNAAHVAINNISIFSNSVAERFDDAIRSLEKNERDCDCIATDLNTGFSNDCKRFLR